MAPFKKLAGWLRIANSPSRAAVPYNLALGGIFALACGFFLLVEILFFGLAPTDTSPFPAWGLWFVAIMFLILGSLCIIGAVADFGDAGTKTR